MRLRGVDGEVDGLAVQGVMALQGGMDCLVRRRAFHSDLRDMLPAFEVWGEAFPQAPPVGTTIGVDSPLPLPVPGCTLLLALIGYIP